MKNLSRRPFSVDINWGRAATAAGLVIGGTVVMAAPAYAAGGGSAGFDQFEQKVTQQTGRASGVAKTVLLTAAVLSLIVGLAPMLWGQIKVKWIVTALCACVLFALTGMMVSAFSDETVAGPGQ